MAYSRHPQWFWSPRKLSLSLFPNLFAMPVIRLNKTYTCARLHPWVSSSQSMPGLFYKVHPLLSFYCLLSIDSYTFLSQTQPKLVSWAPYFFFLHFFWIPLGFPPGPSNLTGLRGSSLAAYFHAFCAFLPSLDLPQVSSSQTHSFTHSCLHV